MKTAFRFPANPEKRAVLWKEIDKSNLPHRPGVYLYKDLNDRIIYVGKAIDLYHRVASYFTGQPDSPKTAALVENVVSCEVIEVQSELEALILEANLIKKYRPQYNIKLTDDKDYLYIKITREPYPRILIARKKELADAKEYFGPFPSARVSRETLKKLRRIFPWCANPPKGENDTNLRPCFFFHIELCPGPCAGKISRKDYNKNINRFAQFMTGEKDKLLTSLQKEMEGYANDLQFEKAQAIKKTIDGLQYLTQTNSAAVYLENPNFVEDQNRQSVEQLQKDLNLPSLPERIECYDISNLQGQQAVGSLVVLTHGDLDKKWYRKFKIHMENTPNDTAMMREVLQRRIKHPEWPKPDLILVDGGKGQVGAAFEVLQQAGWNIPLYGLAKRMEWLYSPEKEVIKLPKRSLSLRVLQKIRDEAHRFAITYHRKLRDSGHYLSLRGYN